MLPFHKPREYRKTSQKNKHSKTALDDNVKHHVERPAKMEYFIEHPKKKKRRGKVSPHHEKIHMHKIEEFHRPRDKNKNKFNDNNNHDKDSSKILAEMTQGRGVKRGSNMYRYVKSNEVNKIHLNEEDKNTIQIIKNIVNFDDDSTFRNYRHLLYNRVSPVSVSTPAWLRDRAAYTAIRQLPLLNNQMQLPRVKLPQKSYVNPVKWRKYICKDEVDKSIDRSLEQHHIEALSIPATTKSNINKVGNVMSNKTKINVSYPKMNATEKARVMKNMHRQRIRRLLIKHACIHGNSLNFQNVLCMKNKLKRYHYDLSRHSDIKFEKWGQEDRDVRGVVPANITISPSNALVTNHRSTIGQAADAVRKDEVMIPATKDEEVRDTSNTPVITLVTGLQSGSNTEKLDESNMGDSIFKGEELVLRTQDRDVVPEDMTISPLIDLKNSLQSSSNTEKLSQSEIAHANRKNEVPAHRSQIYQYHHNRNELLRKHRHFHPHKLNIDDRKSQEHVTKNVQIGPKRHTVEAVDAVDNNNRLFHDSTYHSYTDYAFDNEGYVTLNGNPSLKRPRKIYTNVTYTDEEVKQSTDPHLKLDSLLMRTSASDKESPEDENVKEPFIVANEGEWYAGDDKILVDSGGKHKGDKKTAVKNNKDYSKDVMSKALSISKNMNKMNNREYGADVIAKGVSLQNKMNRNKTQNEAVVVLEDSDGYLPMVKNGYRNPAAEKAIVKQKDYDKKLRIFQEMNEEEKVRDCTFKRGDTRNEQKCKEYLNAKTDVVHKKARGYASEDRDVLVGRDKTVKHRKKYRNETRKHHVKSITKGHSVKKIFLRNKTRVDNTTQHYNSSKLRHKTENKHTSNRKPVHQNTTDLVSVTISKSLNVSNANTTSDDMKNSSIFQQIDAKNASNVNLQANDTISTNDTILMSQVVSNTSEMYMTSLDQPNVNIEAYKIKNEPLDSNFIKRYPTAGFIDSFGSPEPMPIKKIQRANYLAPTNVLTDSRYYYQPYFKYDPLLNYGNKKATSALETANKSTKSPTKSEMNHTLNEIREKKETDGVETIGNVTFISSKIFGKIPNKIYMKAIASPGVNDTSSINAIIYSSKVNEGLNLSQRNTSLEHDDNAFVTHSENLTIQDNTVNNASDDKLAEVNNMIASLLMPKWIENVEEKEKLKISNNSTDDMNGKAPLTNSSIDPILDEAFRKLNEPEIADIIRNTVSNSSANNDSVADLDSNDRRENITTPSNTSSSALDPFTSYSTNMSVSSSSNDIGVNSTIPHMKNISQFTPHLSTSPSESTKKKNETISFANLISRYLNDESIENLTNFDNAVITAFNGCKRNATSLPLITTADKKSKKDLSLIDCLEQYDNIFTKRHAHQKETPDNDNQVLHRTEILNSDEPLNATTAILGLNIKKRPDADVSGFSSVINDQNSTMATQLKFKITYFRRHNNRSANNAMSSQTNHNNDTLKLNFDHVISQDVSEGTDVGKVVSANRTYSVDVDDNDDDTPDISIDVPVHDINGKLLNLLNSSSHSNNASLRGGDNLHDSALNENDEFVSSFYANLTRLANLYQNLTTVEEIRNATIFHNELLERIDAIGKKYGMGKSQKRGITGWRYRSKFIRAKQAMIQKIQDAYVAKRSSTRNRNQHSTVNTLKTNDIVQNKL